MKKLNALLAIFFCITSFSSVELSAAFVSPDEPQVGIDGSGNKMAMWSAYDTINGVYEIRYAINTGSGWSGTNTISDITVPSFTPMLAINSSGDGAAIWDVYDSSTSTNGVAGAIFYQGVWTSPQTLSGAGEDMINRVLSVSNNGDIVVSWSEFPTPSADSEIYSATASTSGGTWTISGPLSP